MKKTILSFILIISVTVFQLSPSIQALTDAEQKKQDAAVKQIMSLVNDDMSDVEKVLIFHDWLTSNVIYDYDTYLKNDKYSYNAYTAYGAFVDKKAVCAGYAYAFQILLDKAGIENKYITGSATNDGGKSYDSHAWNLIKLNGKWYHADATWDTYNYRTQYDYFLVSDKYLNKNHKWDTASYPAAGTSFFGQKENVFYYSNDMANLQISDGKIVFKTTTKLNENKFGVKNTITLYDIKNKKLKTVSKNADNVFLNEKYAVYLDTVSNKFKVLNIKNEKISTISINVENANINAIFIWGDLFVYKSKIGNEKGKITSYNLQTGKSEELFTDGYSYNEYFDGDYYTITETGYYGYITEIVGDYLILINAESKDKTVFYSLNKKTNKITKLPFTIKKWATHIYEAPSCVYNGKLYFTDRQDIYCFDSSSGKLTKLKRPDNVAINYTEGLEKSFGDYLEISKYISSLSISEKNGKAYLIWQIYDGVNDKVFAVKQRQIK